jgi:hypothetical protein
VRAAGDDNATDDVVKEDVEKNAVVERTLAA